MLAVWAFLAFSSFGEVLLREVVSRETSLFVGAGSTNEWKEIASRECTLFIGQAFSNEAPETLSREISILISSDEPPAAIDTLGIVSSPTGSEVELDWSSYNELAERDVVYYAIYYSSTAITDISGMTAYTNIPAGQLSLLFTGLTEWQDHFFVVVPVDAQGNYDPAYTYTASYVLGAEVVSREISLFNGHGDLSLPEVVSRELSIVVDAAGPPDRIPDLVVSTSPTGESVELDWSAYNELAQRDIVRYDIYYSDQPFTDVSTLSVYTNVMAGTQVVMLDGLPAWQTHYFAVVPVDGLGNQDYGIVYSAAYVFTGELVSREVGLFVGATDSNTYSEVISRELSIVVADAVAPAPVTGIGSGFTAITSTEAYQAVELAWPLYNELAQNDLTSYRIYVADTYFEDVSGMEPFETIDGGRLSYTLGGLDSGGIFYVAVVGEDAGGNYDPAVYSVSCQASVGGVGAVRNLAVEAGPDSMVFTWDPPEEGTGFLDHFEVYFGGSAEPEWLPVGTLSYAATNLLAAHGYNFRIVAVDIFDIDNGSSTILGVTWLPNPGNLYLTERDGQVEIEWDSAEPSQFVQRYEIYRSTSAIGNIASMVPVATSLTTRVVLGSLAEVENDWFAVSTVNILGDTDPVVESIQVFKVGQAITFVPIVPGPALIPLSATASSGLPVRYTVTPSQTAEIVNSNSLSVIQGGTVRVAAIQDGNESYWPAEASQTLRLPPVIQSFTANSVAIANGLVIDRDATLAVEARDADGIGAIEFKMREVGTGSWTVLSNGSTASLPVTSLPSGDYELQVSVTAAGTNTTIQANTVTLEPQPVLSVLIDDALFEGMTLVGTVSVQRARSSDLTVTVGSSHLSQVQPGAAPVIPAGQTSAAFEITGLDDETIEDIIDVRITVSAPSAVSAETTVTLVDDDWPGISLSLSRTIVPESAGPNAVVGRIERSITSTEPLTVWLTNSDPTAADVPESVVIPANESFADFLIGAVDDELLDGSQITLISGEIRIDDSAIIQTSVQSLEVGDDEGPTLELQYGKGWIFEGETNQLVVLRRGGATNNPVEVTLSVDRPGELELPVSAVLSNGVTDLPVSMIGLDGTNGTRSVLVTASATNYGPAQLTLVVTDEIKPDFVISAIASETDLESDETFDVTYWLENRGSGLSDESFVQRIFLAQDGVADGNILLAQDVMVQDMPAGGSIEKTINVRAPQGAGEYSLFVIADAGLSVDELVEWNNAKIYGQPLTVGIPWSVTVQTDAELIPANTPILFYGSAVRSGGTKAPFVTVNLHIRVGGAERVVSAVTDANGDYELEWTPLPNEGGDYEVGACHPGLSEAPTQDTFAILTVLPDFPSDAIVFIEGGSTTVVGSVSNPTVYDLTGLSLSLVGAPAGFSVEAVLSNSVLTAGSSVGLSVSIDGDIGYSGAHSFTVRLSTEQGVTIDVPVLLNVIPLTPKLVVYPELLKSSVLRGGSKVYNFIIKNEGGLESGAINVLLPDLSWMMPASTGQVPSIAPGDFAMVSLLLQPGPSEMLTLHSGHMVLVPANGSNKNLPFEFRVVSDETGDLEVTVTDEFTYFAEGSPPVVGAEVVVRDAITAEEILSGVSGTNGNVRFDGLLEGWYTIEVDSANHTRSVKNLQVHAGELNRTEVFISREFVTYRWSVEEIEFEDRYQISIESTYEVNVPAPVVTVTPSVLDVSGLDQLGQTKVINFTIENHGFIDAEEGAFTFNSHPDYRVTPLIEQIGTIPAKSSMIIPVVVQRTGGVPGPDNVSAYKVATSSGGGCGFGGKVSYAYICGIKVPVLVPIPASGAGGGCGGGAVAAAYGGGGGGRGSINSVEFESEVGELNCDCLPLWAFECFIGFTPMGCAYGAGKAAYTRTSKDAALAAIGCIPGTNPLLCYYSLIDCLTSPSSKGGDSLSTDSSSPYDPWYSVVGPELRGQSAELDAALAKIELTYTRYQILLGSRERVMAMDSEEQREWHGKLVEVMQSGSEEAEVISAAEMSELESLAVSLGIPTAAVMPVAERFNRTWDYYARNIKTVADVPPGESTDFIDENELLAVELAMDVALSESRQQGYADPADEFETVFTEFTNSLMEDSDGVCAKVRIKIDQQAVMTRSAFRATLELSNQKVETGLQHVAFDLNVHDSSGLSANDRFNIRVTDMQGLSAIDGSDALGLGADATVQWTLIPRDSAAPSVDTVYLISGTIGYVQDGTPVSIPVQPVPVTVRPDAALHLKYFHQRDVVSDDPHTDPVEAKEPFALAVVVENKGGGAARNLTINSAQPEIVDNEKGLLIDFEIIGSQMGGEARSPSLMADFGNIDPAQRKTATWWMTASLHGFFSDYEATFEHLDGFGDPRISLIKEVRIYEMIRMANALGDQDDGQPDFFTNEDYELGEAQIGDTLHLSDGTVTNVAYLGEGASCSNVVAGNLMVELALTNGAQTGWTYLRFPDPADGLFELAEVVRSDGLVIPVGTNVWTTDRTFIGQGKRPVYENYLHLLDYDSTGVYTLRYAEIAADVTPPSSSVEPLPAASSVYIPVMWGGADDVALATFDIMVSTNGGPWAVWQDDTTRISSIFQGEAGQTYAFYSIATDTAGNVESKAAVQEAVTTVSIINQLPSIALIPDTNITEGATLTYQVVADDPDGDNAELGYSVVSDRTGVTVDDDGLIRWQTSELDGGTHAQIQVTVMDSGMPVGISSQWFTVSVDEVNTAPVLTAIDPQVVAVGSELRVTAVAVDHDVPAQTITYGLDDGYPAGMNIDPVSGLIDWSPPTNLVGQSVPVSVIATDDGAPSVAATNTFTVTVVEKLLDTAPPLPVAGLGVSPDTGLSESDAVLSVTNFSVIGTLPETGLWVEIFEGSNLLASASVVNTELDIPVALGGAGAFELTVRCTDEAGNASDNDLPLTIDLTPPTVDLFLGGELKDATNYLAVASATMVFDETVNVPELMADGLIDAALRIVSSNATVVPALEDLDWHSASNTLVWTVPTNTLGLGEWTLQLDGRLVEDVAGNSLEADGDYTELGIPVYGNHEELVSVHSYAAPVWHDFDGDGLGDLLVGEKTTNSEGRIQIYLNEGSSTNPAPVYSGLLEVDGAPLAVPGAGCLGLSFRLADLTQNGLADLVVGRADGSVWLYETSAIESNTWTIGAGAEIWSGASARAVVDVVDYDADGTNDIVVGGMDGLFRMIGLDGTATVVGPVVDAGRSAPSFTDLNGDGVTNLVSGDTDGDLWAFFGDTAWSLVDTPDTWTRSRPFVADVNGDGVPDILLGTADGRVRLFAGAAPQNPALAFTVVDAGPSHTLTATSGEGGHLEPEGSVTVYEGENQTFAVVPDDYWHVDEVFANGLSLGPVLSHTFINVVENGLIHATFAQNMVTNAPVPVPEAWLAGYGWTNNFEFANTNDFDGDGFAAWQEYVAGTSPTDKASLFRIIEIDTTGTNVLVKWAPSVAGRRYKLMRAPEPGGTYAEVATLDGPADTLTASTMDDVAMYRVEVGLSEAPPQWTVIAFAGANGSISPAGLQYATPGSNTFHFSITPDEWYHVADVKTNGVSVGAVESLTLSNVTANVGIQAEFALNLVVSAPVAVPERYLARFGWTNNLDAVVTNDFDGDGFAVWQEYVAGSSPTNAASFFRITQILNQDGSLLISWTPSIEDRRYRVMRAPALGQPFSEQVGSVVGPANSIIVPASQSMGMLRIEVELTDAGPQWLVMATAGAHGSISPSGLHYASPGSNTFHFAITPAQWYHIADVTVNGVSTGAVETLLLERIDQNMEIHATFAENLVTNAPVAVPEHWLASHGWTNGFSSIVTNDADGDQFSTWQEFVAGSVPTNGRSFLQITNSVVENGKWIIEWTPSVSGRTYTPVLMDLSTGSNAPLPSVEGGRINVSTNAVPGVSGAMKIECRLGPSD
ncbi:CARDB domain-containing protein [Pontiella desulfatans]|nr:CARDB domain-containing protein [Pontiella desulfatans]